MDKDTRDAIERATQRGRFLLQEDFAEQLDGVYDVRPDGRVAEKGGAHLNGRQLIIREKVVAAIEHKRAIGMKPAEAVADYVRDAAFTTLNRFVALKMLEARDLVLDCISHGEASKGFAEFCGLAPGVRTPDSAGYRLFIESIFDELSTEVKVLFDRRDPASALWPKKKTFEELLADLNADELKGVWGEDETIGWVYQFFNSDEERRKMREESPAPRNSRDLAIRNQFFTPRYVVQFLSDNTLGRIWYEMRKGNTRLADPCQYLVRQPGDTFVAEGEAAPPDVIPEGLSRDELWRRPIRVPHRPKKDPRAIRAIDPACGSGHFLLYLFGLFLTIYEEAWGDLESPAFDATGRTLREDYPTIGELRRTLPGLILAHNIHGVDIDPRCTQIAQLGLWIRAQRAYSDFGIARGERPVIQRTNIVIAEAMPGDNKLVEEFAVNLQPAIIGGLFKEIVSEMQLAGEMGTLLPIERKLAVSIDRARKAFQEYQKHHKEGFLPGFAPERSQGELDLSDIDDGTFFEQAEAQIVSSLRRFVGDARNGVSIRRRLFADDAGQGIAFIDLLRHKFDIVLMNPPFGLPSEGCKAYYDSEYIQNRTDIYGAFLMRSVLLLSEGGRIGVICPRSYLYQVTFEPMRRTLLKLGMAPSYIIEMGLGVLDGATVRVALSVFVSGCGTCSYANLTACEKDEKHFNAAFKAICWNSQSVSQIETLPAAAFLFGLSAELKIYLKTAAVRLRAWNGLQTCDDFRFVRLSSEIAGRPTEMWKPFLKPTFFAPYVGVQCTFVNWKEDGREIKAMISQRGESPSRYCNNERKYPASEAWYPDVSERGIGACRVSVPAIPSRTGIALSKPTSLTSGALVAFANSVVAEGLVGVVTPDRHHKPTYLAAVPIPEELASAATDLDNLFENLLTLIPAFGPLDSKYSEPFIGVELKSRGVTALDEILKSLKSRCDEVRKTQQEIDQKVLKALLLSEEDADTLRQMSQRVDPSAWFPHISELDPKISLSEEWIAHQALSVLGGSRQGILPLDEGHLEDFVALLEEALAEKCNEAAGATLRDALSALGVQNLREYVRRADGLYAAFRRLFSASQRRGMPVFNISTLSGSFAVWVDLRRASRDAMFRVQNDYVAPKLAHEQRRLDVLRAEGGANPTTAQRNAIEAQEGLLEELQSFFDEVRRVAPFWKADLDDGVVINLAPLWRLVAQDRAWQKELRTTWDALCRGEYDWAHLAMHLWPERVLPKCATDRSLAIAHGLEDAFWFEDKDGKWKAYDEPRQSIKSLAGSRTSPAVNAALKSLLEAPEIAGGAKRRHKAKAG